MIHGKASNGSSKIPSPRGERGQCDHRAEQRRGRQAGPIAPAVGEDHRHRDQQGHQSLWIQQAVDLPQVWIHRGECCSRQADGVATESLTQQTGGKYDSRADEDRHHLVVEVARAPESRTDRQHDRIQRTMERAGAVRLEVSPAQRLEEATTTGKHVCGGVVEERVAVVGSLGQHRQQGDDAHEESHGDDRRQCETRSHHRSPVAVACEINNSNRGDDHNAEGGGDEQRPDERGDDIAVQEGSAVELEHPLVVLTSDQREGRFARQQHARCR